MTKRQFIAEMVGSDDFTVREVLRLARMPLRRIIREKTKIERWARISETAWGKAQCSCGKLNRDCGELIHAIMMIQPTETPFFNMAPRMKSGSLLHEWVTDQVT